MASVDPLTNSPAPALGIEGGVIGAELLDHVFGEALVPITARGMQGRTPVAVGGVDVGAKAVEQFEDRLGSRIRK